MVLDECVRLLAHRAQESMSLLKGPSPGEPNKLVLALRHRQVRRKAVCVCVCVCVCLMCSLTMHRVRSLSNRMCSLTIECVLLHILRHGQVARTSQQDEAALAATASQSPSPLGRPRHTHIDLCQFFSAHQSTHQSNFAPTSSTSSNEGGQHQAGDDDGECQDGSSAAPRDTARPSSARMPMPTSDVLVAEAIAA